jgi:colanic acid biosynthesis glycosyl transferase WcaI
MRIVVHDFAGHPFQVQLSRELARRGHDVLHLHCPSYTSGKGALSRTAADPTSLEIGGVALSGRFEKYSPFKRLIQERQYAKRLAARVEEFRPTIVISSNTPLFAQRILLSRCRRSGMQFAFWQQDIYSTPMARVAASRAGFAGKLAARAFVRLERGLLRRSDAVVTISEDFEPALTQWGVSRDKVHVIHNWAPLDELSQRPRGNDWARAHDLVGKRVVLYAGTLGIKHNPDLLLRLARRFRAEPDVEIVVVSEGIGADWLRERVLSEQLENLKILPFQPYESLPDVLATGDVLAVILEADASVFSVPSKVLSYLCAGRPLIAAVPTVNLAARTIELAGAGIVTDPADADAFIAAGESLLAGETLREELGANARRYAIENFDIRTIGDRFEDLVRQLEANAPSPTTHEVSHRSAVRS